MSAEKFNSSMQGQLLPAKLSRSTTFQKGKAREKLKVRGHNRKEAWRWCHFYLFFFSYGLLFSFVSFPIIFILF